MKIVKLDFENFIGIKKLELDVDSNLVAFVGPKGSGKTSALEGIEKVFSNNGRRTELIKHGKDEALLFIETDTGLSIDRRLRTEKTDYLKLKKEGEGIKSTEAELRKFLSGDIFRPLDFVELDIKEQTEIILNMIKMDYSDEEIINWFDNEPELLTKINTDKHILQILKDIEKKYYDDRQEINREIKTLEAQIAGIKRDLPDNYDGEKWEEEKLSKYYDKISKAQELNRKMEKAESLIENYEDKISAIKAETKSDISDIKSRYTNEKQDLKDLIQLSKDNIAKLDKSIDSLDRRLEDKENQIDKWLESEIKKLKVEAEQRKEKSRNRADEIKIENQEKIQQYKERIASKKTLAEGLDEKQQIEIDNVKKSEKEKLESEKKTIETAEKYIETKEKVKIEPLQEEANEVEKMRGYLGEWNRMLRIQKEELLPRQVKSDRYTELIEIARSKPGELLHKHELPIPNISVDEDGMIRIDETLLDGLSSGESLTVAFKIALERMGELRVICLDGIERLNESEQKKVVEFCKEHDVQAFITRTEDTKDGKFQIKQGSLF